MRNMTTAGPDRGLFDLILGTNQQEEQPAEGMAPFMEMMKALKDKMQGLDPDSRTDQETMPSKDAVDYRAVGTLGSMLNLSGNPQAVEGLKAEMLEGTNPAPKGAGQDKEASVENALGAALTASASQANSVKQAVPSVDASLVNQMLKVKSDVSLSPAELKLLEQVNAKLATLESGAPVVSEIQPEAKADAMQALMADIQGSKLSTTETNGLPGKSELTPEQQLAAKLEAKGVDPQNVRGAKEDAKSEAAQAKPAEKFVSTESYLKIHEQGPAQASQQSPKLEKVEEPKASKLALVSADAAVSQLAGQKGGKQQQSDLSGGLGKGKEISKAEKDEKKIDAAAPFTHDLLQSLRSESGSKEVFLSGTNAKALRTELSAEVNQNVNLTALKGGGEMKLVIRPDGLGEVKIKVESSKDGKIGVQVIAENEEVARAIKGGSNDLERSLKDQGLSLSKFEVAVKADSAVADANTKNNFSDQFSGRDHSSGFDQWNQNFSQQGKNEGRFGAWDNNQNQRQTPIGMMADDSGTSDKAALKAAAFQRSFGTNSSAGNSSRRLDVVA